jgi:diguanylate cyclase (GGDEF)-like protein/PAS domain S-box-containing protein
MPFETAGIALVPCPSLAAAAALPLEETADLLLLDVGPSGPDGLEQVRRARKSAPHLPLVVLVRGAGPDDVDALLAAGALDCLEGPLPAPADLLRALRQAAARHQANVELLTERERAEVTLGCLGDALVTTDTRGLIDLLNPIAETLCGWTAEEAKGRPQGEVVRILDGASRQSLIGGGEGTEAQGERALPLLGNAVLVRRNGSELPVRGSFAPVRDRAGHALGGVLVFRDATAEQATVQQMAHSAQHDFLTGLPNRVLLNDRIDSAISIAPRHRKKVAVLFLDLDGFKQINDTLGHLVGDKLLQSVARRLMGCVRGSDTVSRQGGDEFVVLLSEVERPEDAAITARRMIEAVASVHTLDREEVRVTTSIGIAVYPDDGTDAETLIRSADTAMYQAKESGRHAYRFFKPAMNLRAVERQEVEESLRRALEREEFSLHFQPKVNLRTGQVSGAEALLRWEHPHRGVVSPALFVPVAEASGLMPQLGAWVMREACRQVRAWHEEGLRLPRVSVNVSALQFQGPTFIDGVFDILNDTGLDPRALELEVTEAVLMKEVEAAESKLHALRASGIQISVDDFGTGYSSLNSLRRFPIQALKIDQSFVREIGVESEASSVVTAVLNMAQSFNFRVVAEGVETPEELAFLQYHRCDEAQGYYFSRPLLPAQFARLLVDGLLPTMAARQYEHPAEGRPRRRVLN